MAKKSQAAQFSMSQFQSDWERDARDPKIAAYLAETAEFGLIDDVKRSFNRGSERGARAGAEARKVVNNAGRAIGEKAVAAKNKVAVLVKGANGKAFIQQRWKNVADAGRAVGGFVKGQSGKAGQALEKAYARNPNAVKVGAFIGGAALGYGAVSGAKKLMMNEEKDKPKSQQLFPNG